MSQFELLLRLVGGSTLIIFGLFFASDCIDKIFISAGLQSKFQKYIIEAPPLSVCKEAYQKIIDSDNDFVSLSEEVGIKTLCDYSKLSYSLINDKFDKICPGDQIKSYSQCISSYILNRKYPKVSEELILMAKLAKLAEQMDLEKGGSAQHISLIKLENAMKAMKAISVKKLCFYKKRPLQKNYIKYQKWKTVIKSEQAKIKKFKLLLISKIRENLEDPNFGRFPSSISQSSKSNYWKRVTYIKRKIHRISQKPYVRPDT